MTELPPNFRPDAFAGVADDYVRYRLPYPRALLDGFLGEARLGPTPRLLDLACGTGRLTLAIAGRFAEVWAIDAEPAMLEAGRREAERRGVGNVRWSVGRAEDFAAPAGTFDLVTIAEAFHRLDRPRVAGLVHGWLKPGGGFVTLGFDSLSDGETPWREIVRRLMHEFVGVPATRFGAPNATLAQAIADETATLEAAGFTDIASRRFPVDHVWTLESLLGNLRSTSVLSRQALGARHAAFEAALSEALLAYDPSGRYPETVGCGYTFARRP
jgi:SAM-dependent methyltransferase